MTAPWTPRERALREALKYCAHYLHAIRKAIPDPIYVDTLGDWCATHPSEEHLEFSRHDTEASVNAALSDPPTPDPRDEALRLAEEALKKAKCRCTKALDNTCPTCGETLIAVRYSGYLNEDQWDAIKGGDWYCNTCTDPSIVNGKKHWHDRELQTVTYQTCSCCDALAAIAAAKGEG